MVETAIWENGRNHAISPVVYHFMEKRSVTLVARARPVVNFVGQRARLTAKVMNCETATARPPFVNYQMKIYSGRPVVRSPLIIE